MKYVMYVYTPIKEITLVEEEGNLVGLYLQKVDIADAMEKETELLKQTRKELEEYFKGNQKKFTIPIRFIRYRFSKKSMGRIKKNFIWRND